MKTVWVKSVRGCKLSKILNSFFRFMSAKTANRIKSHFEPRIYPTGIDFLKVNNGKTRTICKNKVKIKTLVFPVNIEHSSRMVQVFQLLT